MKANTRIEHDSMGPLEVPADALWGAQTQRAIQNFPPIGFAHAARLHSRVGSHQACRGGRECRASAICRPLLPRPFSGHRLEVAEGRCDERISRGCFSNRVRHQQQYERQRGDCDAGVRELKPRCIPTIKSTWARAATM